VGTTTIAVNLAVALAHLGRRTVLADVSPSAGDASILCGLAGQRPAADMSSGRNTIADLLEPGPGGVRVLIGPWCDGEMWSSSSSAEDRLIEEVQVLGPMADFLIVDAGNSPSRIARRLWHASDVALLVATPDLASVMNAYAAVKALGEVDGPADIFTVINMAPTTAVADDIHGRLALACRRFLGVKLRPAGFVPLASQIEDAGRRGEPFVLASPGCPACREIEHLSRWLTTA
jgi:flagellar biosynthesis protein FlhG